MLFGLAIAPSVRAQTDDRAIARNQPAIIPAGTEIPLVTSTALSSKTSAKGDVFDLSVAENVAIAGHVLIPKGTRAVGELIRAEQRDMFGASGKLEARLLYIVLNGESLRLEGRLVIAGRQEIKGKSGTAATVGAIVAAGSLGFIVTGKSAVIPAGTMITGVVERGATIDR